MGEKKEKGMTHYQVITGPDTIFVGNKKLRLQDITDGTSNTGLIVEAKDPVTWTKPSDLVLPKEKDKLPAMGGMFSNGFNVAFCDGSVRMLPLSVTAEVFRPIVTPKGGD